MRPLIFYVVLLAMLSARTGAGAIVIGGFDSSRAGTTSIVDGSRWDDLRVEIQQTFPGVVISSSSSLTDSFLQGIDVLFVSAVYAAGIQIAPLSPSEQDSIVQFVTNGGGAVIFTDNPGFKVAGDSLVGPFGLETGGAGFAGVPSPPVTVYHGHPVIDGPHGTVDSILTLSPGAFSDLGDHATALATFSNGRPAVAVIGAGRSSPMSGAIVFVSDGSVISDGFATPDNYALAMNAIAFAATPVPEPSAFLIWSLLSTLGLVKGWRRRRRSPQALSPLVLQSRKPLPAATGSPSGDATGCRGCIRQAWWPRRPPRHHATLLSFARGPLRPAALRMSGKIGP